MKDSSTATERVGRYQLLEPIGGGPNGVVARAKVFGVAGFERQFAIKRFMPELTVGPHAQALSAAARSYGSLEHPRIARMSEFGVAQGQTFTAVEYVVGLDAARLMQESKLAGIAIAAGGALALVSQAARAVGYAHGRGLSHLGLSPSNVIVTADGDVKVTDFGILAATMPAKPVEVTRLAQRIAYLAPEQLAGEATSAATDVFVLGVIAYELVTGQRAYRGETAAQIAQAIQAGPPAEPPLPRPIVRVLQRCLARSPFERFPDARALADALDAALRVAPVPGTRKDIGAQIKTTLDRYASLNEGNLSGVVALNLQTAPLAQSDPTPSFSRPEARTEPSPVVPGSSTIPELRAPFSTQPGIAPPPIPVPPGVTPPPSPPQAAGGVSPKTMLGLPPVKQQQQKVPSVLPSITKKTNGPGAPPPSPRGPTPPPLPAVEPPSDVIEEPSGLIEVEDIAAKPSSVTAAPRPAPDRSSGPHREPSGPTSSATASSSGPIAAAFEPPADAAMKGPDPTTMQGIGPTENTGRVPRLTPAQDFESRTGEMSPVMVERYSRRSVQNTGELAVARASEGIEPITASGELGGTPAPDAQRQARPSPVEPDSTAVAVPPRTSGSRMGATVALVVVVAGLGAASWYAYTAMKKPGKVASTPAKLDAAIKIAANVAVDAAVPVVSAPPDSANNGSGGSATGSAKPGTGKPGGETPTTADKPGGEKPSSADKPTMTPSGAADTLQINSKPAGARVFIDGADQGVSPVKLPGSADRHTMVLLLPGHELYIGEVDGHGVFDVNLKAVTPSGGHAGIKVIKCKAKERYYVFVDGKATGMTCPTERIDTVVGPHTVEVYDIVTDSRRKFDINVKDERLSARVRIDD